MLRMVVLSFCALWTLTKLIVHVCMSLNVTSYKNSGLSHLALYKQKAFRSFQWTTLVIAISKEIQFMFFRKSARFGIVFSISVFILFIGKFNERNGWYIVLFLCLIKVHPFISRKCNLLLELLHVSSIVVFLFSCGFKSFDQNQSDLTFLFHPRNCSISAIQISIAEFLSRFSPVLKSCVTGPPRPRQPPLLRPTTTGSQTASMGDDQRLPRRLWGNVSAALHLIRRTASTSSSFGWTMSSTYTRSGRTVGTRGHSSGLVGRVCSPPVSWRAFKRWFFYNLKGFHW